MSIFSVQPSKDSQYLIVRIVDPLLMRANDYVRLDLLELLWLS